MFSTITVSADKAESALLHPKASLSETERCWGTAPIIIMGAAWPDISEDLSAQLLPRQADR